MRYGNGKRLLVGVVAAPLGLVMMACGSGADGEVVKVDPAAVGATSDAALVYVEGAFDSTTGALSVAYRDPTTGALLPETAATSTCDGGTCPYGTSTGQVYLHTAGTHGDGYTNAPFAPPTFGTGSGCLANVLCFGMSPENGMPGTLSNFTFVLDNITPSTVTFGLAATNPGGTCKVEVGGSAPCTVVFGSVAHTSGFPTPSNTGVIGMGFDDSANNGANFTFSGHVTAS